MIKKNAFRENHVRNIAVFDLDHTLSKRDTYLHFLLSFLIVHPLNIVRCVFLPLAVLMHKLRLRDNSWLKEKFLRAVAKGSQKDHINAFSETFAKKIVQSGLHPSAQARIEQHRLSNDYLILASASFDFYVIPIARLLGFDKTVCTRAEWDASDRLTGRIVGNNCYGEFKKTATEKVFAALFPHGTVTIYSDHHSDLPVFSLATHAVAVNPTAKLRTIAATSNMSIEHWD
jgi:phosphatidylglycerophosphatase C